MRVSQWLMLVGVLVSVGMLQVAQRTAIVRRGYALGQRTHRLHEAERDVAWLRAQLQGLSSPNRLTDVSQTRQQPFIAWSLLSQAPRTSQTTPPVALSAPEPSDGKSLQAPSRGSPRESRVAQASPAD